MSASGCRSEPANDHTMSMPTQLETVSTSKEILGVIDYLKKQVVADRCISIKKRVEENRQKLSGITSHLYKLSTERTNSIISDQSVILLSKRQKDAHDMQNGIVAGNRDKDSSSSQEYGLAPSAILLGSSVSVKNAVRAIKLADVKKLPPYTTWIFLDRNQRMMEDQSVVGRRRIYYDQNGGEALICSDSEEDAVEDEEEKKEFVESEDYILRMTIKEVGLTDIVLELLAQCFSRKPCEVKARYETLTKEVEAADVSQAVNPFVDKDLDTALDSFDNLFCRRCLVFDCRLHGCSQDLVFPAEKQSPWNSKDEENIICGPHCYRLALMSENFCSPACNNLVDKPDSSPDGVGARILSVKKSIVLSSKRKEKSSQSRSASSNAKNISESDSDNRQKEDSTSLHDSPSPTAKMVGADVVPKRNSKRFAERVLTCVRKRLKKTGTSDSDSIASEGIHHKDIILKYDAHQENEDASSSSQKKKKTRTAGKPKESPSQGDKKLVYSEFPESRANEILIHTPAVTCSDDILKKEEYVDENICQQELVDNISWKTIEKSLFLKGLEIFGRNSCLISRNLMNGMKTCFEVFEHMNYSNSKLGGSVDGANSLVDGYSKLDFNDTMGGEMRQRSRFLRRRGRVRRLKYTWKSAGYHSIRKRISEKKDQPCRQYNPCGCDSICGKLCNCLLNGTCCEKYCGCPKSCKIRFRGCHCAKSQCRSRQCPCFAADRECDPDVCRNCWVSCGDGDSTLGIPSQRGDNYECRNMKLLLKQQQRVLLGRSDVSGWGAFLKNTVGKHEYLGEYTGELISHREADKRGKIYDRENSSFLFNLNDQFVLDAYRKGDKLKFANHSPVPNCYAKVLMVAGDHRVGIFAKERINAGEELFYDYRYEPDRAPLWARKPDASGSKRDESGPSSGRAKKLA